ncbi:transglutaminase domain-containing protein [Microbacterium sp. ZW T5_56]|uniref:transglutaminase domain-containing protein n=1 Tax=Microbacterium sp. ZW T5_56 TaxID=3378081 RepID=UPI003854457D
MSDALSSKGRRATSRTVIAGSVFVGVLAALGIVAAWPIYSSPSLLWTAGAAILTGAAIAVLWVWRRLPAWLVALLLVAAWLILGIALGVPERWATGRIWPDGVVDVLLAPVTAWKDLITTPLPVGSYRNLLVPAIIVFLVSVTTALRLSWLPAARSGFAVPVAALMPVFGLLFGRTSTSAPLQLGAFSLPAPVETAVGAASLLVSVLWLSWRGRDDRREAIRRAERATGVHGVRRGSRGSLSRTALAGAMVMVALAAGVAATGPVGESRVREVLRTSIGPDLTGEDAISPLITYRSSFADDRFPQVLFRLTSDDALPERIRLATLSAYDGQTYQLGDGAEGSFQRVPSVLDTPAGESASVTFTVEALRGVWLPTFGSMRQIAFSGSGAPTLADGFYYDPRTSSAVEAAGVATGDSYTVTAVTPTSPDLQTLPAPGAAPQLQLPAEMQRWLDVQAPSRDGAGLLSAIGALRERGYLSHALTIADGSTPGWMSELGDYGFRPSAAGHSLARIDKLFAQLNERAAQAALEAPGASLVAAVGDDEQFAVAGALIAEQLGFPARVVVGFRTDDPTLPSCQDGACRAGDLAAWIEVAAAPGTWVSVDTSPQHTASVETQNRRERDPEVMTDVRPRNADEVSPPDPQNQEAVSAEDPTPPPAPETVDWTLVRTVAISLLAVIAVLSPFLIVVIAKAVRRRGRRLAEPASAVAGGWEEYVDTAVDTGRPVPAARTRHEVAALYATPQAGELATLADRAVFSDEQLSVQESEQFWQIVADERRELRSSVGWWRRLRAAVSLKSLLRQTSARAVRTDASGAARASERRKRRPRGAGMS